MKDDWKYLVVTGINLALYVAPASGSILHRDRPFHGFVLNSGEGRKEYSFSDGQILHTEGRSLFYLPKHSTYRVRSVEEGGCYAINFDAEIDDRPFSVIPKNFDVLKRSFSTACGEWKADSPSANAAAVCALYDALYCLLRERETSYAPSGKLDKITPALEEIERNFTDTELSVGGLAAMCSMSEVYFRRLFQNKFGISPKEYIIRRRISYASQLLSSGEVSVQSVARLCGYGEECHFSREFSRRVGVPPSEYKKG